MRIRTAKFYALLLISLVARAAMGSTEEAHHDVHIPWNELIIPQTVNLLILVGGLTYAIRGAVKGFFAGRAASFESARNDAEKAKQSAQETHIEVKRKLEQLDATSKSSLQTAKKEAEQLKTKIVGEAKQMAERLEQEAKRSAAHELQKAAFALRTELIGKALEVADKEISSGLDNKTQGDLQAAFVARAQGVRL